MLLCCLVRNRRIIFIIFLQLHRKLNSIPIYFEMFASFRHLHAFRAALLVYLFVFHSKRAYSSFTAIWLAESMQIETKARETSEKKDFCNDFISVRPFFLNLIGSDRFCSNLT